MFGKPEDYRTSAKASTLMADFVAFCKDNRSVREEKWRRYDLVYENQHDMAQFSEGGNEYPYESDLKLPTCFTHVEGIQTTLSAALLSNNPMIEVIPKTGADAEKARRYGWKLHDQFENDIRIRHKLPMWLRQAVRYPEWPLKVGWGKTTRRVNPKVFDPHTGNWGRKAKDEKIEIKGAPTVESIERWNVYVDPWGTDDESCRAITHRMVWSPEMLKDHVADRKDAPWEHKAIEKVLKGARKRGDLDGKLEVDTSTEERLKRLNEQGKRTGYTASEKDARLFEVWDHWEDEIHMMGVGDIAAPIIILREPNPYWHGKKPIVFLRFIQVDKQFDGKCVPEIGEALFHQIDTIVNQRLDNVNRCINQSVPVNIYQIDIDELTSRPHGPIAVKGNVRGAYEVYQPPDVTHSAYTEVDYATGQLERATGFTGVLQGDPSGSDETARGLNIRRETAGGRFEGIAGSIAAGPLSELVKMVHSLNRQFLGDSADEMEGEVRVQGDDGAWTFEKWLYSDVQGNFEFEFTIDPTQANRSMHLQMLTNYIGATAGNPEASAMLQWGEIHKSAFDRMGSRNAGRFLKGEDTIAEHENAVFRHSGFFAPVSSKDNDPEHIESHSGLLADGSITRLTAGMQEAASRSLAAHVRDHQQQAQQKEAADIQRGQR